MAIHRWSITRLDTGVVVRQGVCLSGYGDESLVYAYEALTGLGVGNDGISAISYLPRRKRTRRSGARKLPTRRRGGCTSLTHEALFILAMLRTLLRRHVSRAGASLTTIRSVRVLCRSRGSRVECLIGGMVAAMADAGVEAPCGPVRIQDGKVFVNLDSENFMVRDVDAEGDGAPAIAPQYLESAQSRRRSYGSIPSQFLPILRRRLRPRQPHRRFPSPIRRFSRHP